MPKRDLVQQIERELTEARRSVTFWQSQLPLFNEEPLKSAVQLSLERALATMEALLKERDLLGRAVGTVSQ